MDLSYFHQAADEPLLYKTYFQVFDATAERVPDREAIVDFSTGERVTFRQFKQKVDSFAAGLLALGFKKNDRLGLWGPNYIEWCVAFMGAAKAGAISVLLNPLFTRRELEYCIKKVGIKAIVTPSKYKFLEFLDTLLQIIPDLKITKEKKIQSTLVPSLHYVITTDEETFPSTIRFTDVQNMATEAQLKKMYENALTIQPEDGCNIQFTSGTTGSPKATLLSHLSLVNNSLACAKQLQMQSDKSRLCVQVPLFHAFGAVGACCGSVHFGTTFVLTSPAYSPTKTLETIETERCSIIFGTPTMFIDMLKLQKEKHFDLSSLTLIVVGGASSSPELKKDIRELLKIDVFSEAYGMTECSGAICLPKGNREFGLGPFLDHFEVKIVDEKGAVVPVGVPGELCVRSYSTMICYWDDEEKTRNSKDVNGWLHTGDQFTLSRNGKAEMIGRIKDMINRGGENIFPKEIEDILCTHPNIEECSVFAIPDPRLGEDVCAAIKLRSEDKTITAEEIHAFCKDHIAVFKIPKHLKFLRTLPKTVTGKISKIQLQDMVEKKLL